MRQIRAGFDLLPPLVRSEPHRSSAIAAAHPNITDLTLNLAKTIPSSEQQSPQPRSRRRSAHEQTPRRPTPRRLRCHRSRTLNPGPKTRGVHLRSRKSNANPHGTGNHQSGLRPRPPPPPLFSGFGLWIALLFGLRFRLGNNRRASAFDPAERSPSLPSLVASSGRVGGSRTTGRSLGAPHKLRSIANGPIHGLRPAIRSLTRRPRLRLSPGSAL